MRFGHEPTSRLARRSTAATRRSWSACRTPARTSRPISKAVSSRPGSRARTPTGGSTGSTISPPISARRSIRTAISRTVIDVNRDPSGVSLYPGQATTELCPTTTFDGEPLYAPGAEPDADEIAERAPASSIPITRRSARDRAAAGAARQCRALRLPLDPLGHSAPVRGHAAPFQHRHQWRHDLRALR